MSEALLVDAVVSEVLSYTLDVYLYTGTVCHAWYKSYSGRERTTSLIESTVSVSRVENEEFFHMGPTMTAAAINDSLDAMKHLRSRGVPWGRYTFVKSVEMGSLDTMKWLHGQGCKCGPHSFFKAAKIGSLSKMRWLLSVNCEWDKRTFMGAAANGNRGNMMWLLEKKCPWDERTFSQAAACGSLENCRWLMSKKCPRDYEDAYDKASSEGRENIIEWLMPRIADP